MSCVSLPCDAGTTVVGASAAAQGADDVDLTVWLKRNRQIPHLFFIHEDSDVLSNRVLFGDDAKAQAGIATIQCYNTSARVWPSTATSLFCLV